MFSQRSIAAACLLVAASSVMAAGVAGKWSGKLLITLGAVSPAQAKTMQSMKAMWDKMVFHLELKGNKTYTLSASGGPKGMPNNADAGTWSQSGRSVTLTSSRRQKGPGQAQTLNLSSDGKTLTLALPGSAQGSGKMVFKKG